MEELKNTHGEKLTFWKFYLCNTYNVFYKLFFPKYHKKICSFNFNEYMSEKMQTVKSVIYIISWYVLPVIVDYLAGYGVFSQFIRPCFNEDYLWVRLLLLFIVFVQMIIYLHIGILVSCVILYPHLKKRVKMNLGSDGEIGLFKKMDKLLRKDNR